MTDISREHIRSWLRDAHAMEEQSERLFQAHLERMKDFPEVHSKLLLESSHTKDHQEILSIRIQQLGSAPSLLKDAGAKLLTGFQNLIGTVTDEQPVKTMLALHTFTYFIIGSYQILITAALEINDEETFRVCKVILSQAHIRASWIEDQLAAITRHSIRIDDSVSTRES